MAGTTSHEKHKLTSPKSALTMAHDPSELMMLISRRAPSNCTTMVQEVIGRHVMQLLLLLSFPRI